MRVKKIYHDGMETKGFFISKVAMIVTDDYVTERAALRYRSVVVRDKLIRRPGKEAEDEDA